MEKVNFTSPSFNIPIEFEKIQNVIDDRFMKVKVWIAHTGENRNNSIFSKEVLTSMIPSLANIPILGYIAVDENGKDFAGHEERLVIEDGQFELKYFGRAYGLIPTEHNARFETRFGEDGLEREYLVCDGLIWNKFPEVSEIFDRDEGYKPQSMELQHSSIKGYTDENGRFVFTQAKFEGACLLGENVSPAMVSSTIERFSVSDKIQVELSEMLTEFNAHFSSTKVKGDETVLKDNEDLNKDTTVENEFTSTDEGGQGTTSEPNAEPATEPTVVTPSEDGQTAPDDNTVESEKSTSEGNTDFAKDDEEDEDEDKDSKKKKDEEDEEEEDKDKFTRTFELSHDDIRSGLYSALDQHDMFKDSWFYVSQVFDSHAIVENEDSGKFFKVNYVKHENAVEVGDTEEIFPMWVNQTEQSAIEMSRNNFSALEKEVEGLREFKENIETTEKEQKLAQYSKDLTSEEYKSIKENIKNFSVNDMEKEIGFMLLKKNHFSAKTDEVSGNARIQSTNTVESNPYGDASVYFSK